MEISQTFGNSETFAIHYRVNEEAMTDEVKTNFAYCHLIINNRLIGYPDEVCHLRTWCYYLTRQKEFIKQNKSDLFPKEFLNLSDREIFESILIANQEEEDIQKEFLYLPRLSNSIWSNHTFNLDETIDAYLFYYYVRYNKIGFLIEDRSKQNRNIRSDEFIFFSLDLETFFRTVDETISFLVIKYPYLQDQMT